MNSVDSDLNIDPYKSNILVVDDEAANIKLLSRMLDLMGFDNVVCTQDPLEVVPLHNDHNFDLILLDLDMPELDGYGVMQKLGDNADGFLPPILVLTAQHLQSHRQRALDSGARDYVTKPFDASELVSRMRNLLEVHIAQKYMRNQNAYLERKIYERTQEIHTTRLQVVRRLGRAAEYRDNETGLHIVRMSKIAALLGKAAGMNDYECDLLLNAAPMHDIGKIGIPDNILLKPGKLDPEEWKIMMTHAQIGSDILSGDDSDLLRMASEVALTHHEKWDGSGYPNGLKGNDIPLVGRLCAISDVFDALTSERPYKKAWSIDAAVEFIQSQSGKHFDPDLVDLFIVNFNKIVAIKKKYAEPE